MNKHIKSLLPAILMLAILQLTNAQITERSRPQEWDSLVAGARFIDRFKAMPDGETDRSAWGTDGVQGRYTNNGIEDNIRSYWGGNLLQTDDGTYHLFVCGWPENSPKGHFQWPYSTVYRATCNNTTGPFVVIDTIGAGHNPEAFRTKEGYYVIYVIDGYYRANSIEGPWSFHKFQFDNRDRNIIEGLSNLTFAQREDGSWLMVCRGGGIWISKTGLSTYNQITDRRVYPDVKGEFEDPVVWRDHVQYHLIVNDWLGRIAFYQRSKDGVNWVTDPGEAYTPGISFHKDGTQEKWFKYERPKVFQDKYGRAVQMNFAVIDTLKNDDKANDNHSSKNIGIPLNPGVLITMLNQKPITGKTKTIRIRIAAEEHFNPATDMDIPSLRFGASSAVNFGKGCRVVETHRQGNDLILTFDATGHGLTADEFAPKLIGKRKSGEMVYGYTRLPWIDYTTPLLSARQPVFSPANDKTGLKITVENFGQVVSQKAKVRLTYTENKKQIEVGTAKLQPLQPYASAEVVMPLQTTFETGKTYDFELAVTSGKNTSTYRFKKKIEE